MSTGEMSKVKEIETKSKSREKRTILEYDKPLKEECSKGSSTTSIVVVRPDDHLIESGLALIGDSKHWTAEEMFSRNEVLTGRKVKYDGNPQRFASEGFIDGVDPHVFRVVDGDFMNSDSHVSRIDEFDNIFGKDSLENCKSFQHSFPGTSFGLKPFFRNSNIKEPIGGNTINKSVMINSQKSRNMSGFSVNSRPLILNNEDRKSSLSITVKNDNTINSLFKKSTKKLLSNRKKDSSSSHTDSLSHADNVGKNGGIEKVFGHMFNNSGSNSLSGFVNDSTRIDGNHYSNLLEHYLNQCTNNNEHITFMRKWVKSLPETYPSKHFGDFRFNIDDIMIAMYSSGFT